MQFPSHDLVLMTVPVANINIKQGSNFNAKQDYSKIDLANPMTKTAGKHRQILVF